LVRRFFSFLFFSLLTQPSLATCLLVDEVAATSEVVVVGEAGDAAEVEEQPVSGRKGDSMQLV
jgi:hypothetical protein